QPQVGVPALARDVGHLVHKAVAADQADPDHVAGCPVGSHARNSRPESDMPMRRVQSSRNARWRAAGRRWRPWCSRTVAASSPAMHRPSTRGVEMTDHSPDVPPAQADVPSTLAHRLTPMRGRDPSGAHRVATPLELLFGPTFVVAFSVAGQQASHLFAEGHISSALLGFRFAMFAIMWAWINHSWFASAFDCDDWVYRLTTMVQMVGVVVGYIVMRVTLAGALVLIEMSDPVIAERRQ